MNEKNLQQEILDEIAQGDGFRDWDDLIKTGNMKTHNHVLIAEAIDKTVAHTLARATAEILKEVEEIVAEINKKSPDSISVEFGSKLFELKRGLE